jgi:predicted 3-demethylubiquinone-9 3-methyltransferase (glyoxalase superfamily)
MNQKVLPFLMFQGQAEEAMNFYLSLFPKRKVLDFALIAVRRNRFAGWLDACCRRR